MNANLMRCANGMSFARYSLGSSLSSSLRRPTLAHTLNARFASTRLAVPKPFAPTLARTTGAVGLGLGLFALTSASKSVYCDRVSILFLKVYSQQANRPFNSGNAPSQNSGTAWRTSGRKCIAATTSRFICKVIPIQNHSQRLKALRSLTMSSLLVALLGFAREYSSRKARK